MCRLRLNFGILLGWLLALGFAQAAQRKVPDRVPFAELTKADLRRRAVPLAEAHTRFRPDLPERRAFNPEIVLIKFISDDCVRVLRVDPGRESDALSKLRARDDVAFAELDTCHQRQFAPNDPFASNQWHHPVIGSFEAWNYSRGEPFVRIAIVDTPFQMNHPDLAAQTDPGWDVVDELPVTSHTGDDHSTMCAGMAAAGVNNIIGIAGAGNCRLVPININGALSEMHNAIRWAADHAIRLVSISWTGANSDTLNDAAQYLRTKARGLLLMPGVNGTGFLDYTNQPYIHCVSMTDAADNIRSRHGNHIDFSAPGWDIYSTTTNNSYRIDSGTSYATPLLAGILAVLLSINPLLSGDEAIELLKNTAHDLGAPGWDQFFGCGRVNFAAAAAAARATLPPITSITLTNGHAFLTTQLKSGVTYELWTSHNLTQWQPANNPVAITNNSHLTLSAQAPHPHSFYRIRFAAP